MDVPDTLPAGQYIIYALIDLMNQEQMPSMEQLTEAISDLLHCWLEPKHSRSRRREEDEVS